MRESLGKLHMEVFGKTRFTRRKPERNIGTMPLGTQPFQRGSLAGCNSSKESRSRGEVKGTVMLPEGKKDSSMLNVKKEK